MDGKSNDSNEMKEITTTPMGMGGDTKVKKKRKNYTAEEDNKILDGVKKFGTDWDEIVKWSHLDR